MAPKTRGARKREQGEDAGGKEAGEREGSKKTQRRGKKYIGAHVSIQGKVFLVTAGGCLEQNSPRIGLLCCRGDLESCGVLRRDGGQLLRPVSGLPALMEETCSGPEGCSQVSGAVLLA